MSDRAERILKRSSPYQRIVDSLAIHDCQTIQTDKATAQKIASAFVNRGWWFMMYHVEGSYFITMSNDVDLGWFSRRDYKFTIE